MKTKSTTLGATGCGSHWRLWKVVVSVILSTFFSFNAVAQCDPPTGISVTVLSNSQAQVTWTNPPGTLWINLQYRELPSGSFGSPLSLSGTTLLLSGLNSGTNYELRMLSKCAGNTQSGYSATVPFTTMATNPCGTVSIVVGNSTNTTTSISWAPIPGASYYRVRTKLSSSMTWDPIVTTSNTNMTFNSLTQASEYDVQVQTVCTLPVEADWSEIATMETCDPNNLTTISESACDSYTWGLNGQTYTASGTYSYTGSYPNSCPQYFVLNLTITPSAPYPTLACYETATFNSTTCSWDISGSQPAMPPMVNCWDNFVFNTQSCAWDNTGSQPAMPPMVNCWDNFVFNTTTCAWDNTGSQPAMPSMVNCWDNFVFNTTTCVWDNTGSQPAMPPMVNCWDNFVFNTQSCAWDNTGSQPAMPPMVNCWDNFVFNTTTCAWDNTGSQPAMPSMVNCWDNFVFNTTTCVWDNTGSQPAMPPMVNCWDNFVFNTTTCAWDNTGSQPAMPPMVNCWDNFVFNTTTCVWDNTGSQPAMPPMVNCWDNFVFNTQTCAWDNTGSQPAMPPMVNCWDNFVFNTTTCVWDNTGSQPAMPPMVNCWDNFVFNTTTCVWDNTGSQPAMPPMVNCWDNFVFNTTTCVWDNTGSQPAMPPMVNCWDNFVFNTTTCAWDNTGSQPAMPPMVNCWDNFVFNTTTCAWDNTGSQPAMPPMVNCWDNFVFNTTTCAWDNTGSQPAMPPMVNCWDNFVFNTTTCAWDNTGSQPAMPPMVNCWDNFVFNTQSCAWDNTGSQPAMPPMVNCWDNFVFNTTTCVWDNTGSQPAMPTGLLCYQSAVFNTGTCAWDIVGTAPYNVTPASACGSYTWNGNTYTTSGMYTHNVLNTNPCGYDVLDLTINPIPMVTAQDFSACPNTTINIAPFVSPAPSMASTFTPSNPYNGPGGLYTYTYVDPSTGCSASATGTITRTNSIAITGLTVTGTTNNTATVVWSVVPGASWYTIRYNNGSGWQYATSSTPSIVLTGLLSGTYYDLEARANCSVLNPGAYLAYSNFTTATTCFPVTNLTATPVAGSNGTKLNVTFTNPNGSGWSLLNYSTSPSGPWTPYSPAIAAGTVLTGLSPNTLYYVRVQAKCNALDYANWVLTTQTTGGTSSKGVTEEVTEAHVSAVSIYPNPTRDVLNIEVKSAENASTSLKIFDMSGRLVKQVQANTEIGVNNLVIDLKDLSNGIYTLQVLENEKLVNVTKVYKQD